MAEPRRRGWRRFGSVRLRTTLVATVAFGLAFAVASIVLVRSVRASLEDELRADATVALDEVAAAVAAGVPPYGVALDPGGGVFYQVIAPGGEVVAGSPGTGGVPLAIPLEGEANISFERSTAEGEQFVSTRTVASPAGPRTVAVASPLDDVRETVDTLSSALWVGIPLLIAVVALAVWFLVGRALRPVDAIRAEVEEITHASMDRRVPVPAARDEVARLAVTMNEMLDRLDQASVRQRQFVSDASHELRSPVATMHAALELGLREPARTDWPGVATSVLAEDRRMAGIIDDLLDLSRLDEDGAAGPGTVLDLDEVVLEEIARLGDGRVEAGGVSGGRVRGHREQLARAVRNLLANAVRHARERVAVGLRTEDGHVVLTVDDDGAGVSEAERETIFDRFTRLDDGRARDDGGSGLGLAIVRAAATRHGGHTAAAASPLGGARFTLQLPTIDAS